MFYGSQLLTVLNLNFRNDQGWAGILDLHRLPGSEDGQRLGRADVSVGPGPGLSLRVYSTDPRHLVWHWAPGSGLGPGLQLQNIPTHKKIIRQVLSGEINIPGFDIKSDSAVEVCGVEAVFCIVWHMCLWLLWNESTLVYYLLIEKLLHLLFIQTCLNRHRQW